MPNKIDDFNKIQLKKNIPDIKPGDTVRLHQKIKEKDKERIQVFEGVVIAIKHGKGISSAITVRKVMDGVGVERVFPIHSPNIAKIEITRRVKTRRAKLYYLREARGKKSRLKKKEFAQALSPEENSVPSSSSQPTEQVLVEEKGASEKA